MDEIWVFHHDPESKQEAKEWCEPGTSAPKRVRVHKSAKKVLASVFWDAKGILLVDYLQTCKTINSEYYCNLLDPSDAKIREKRPGLQKKKILFHQDNAPAHTAQKTPSDFWLFPHLKKFLRRKHFSSNEEVIAVLILWEIILSNKSDFTKKNVFSFPLSKLFEQPSTYIEIIILYVCKDALIRKLQSQKASLSMRFEYLLNNNYLNSFMTPPSLFLSVSILAHFSGHW